MRPTVAGRTKAALLIAVISCSACVRGPAEETAGPSPVPDGTRSLVESTPSPGAEGYLGWPEGVPKPEHRIAYATRDEETGLPRLWRGGCSTEGVAWIEHHPPVGEPVMLPDPDGDGIPELPSPWDCDLTYTDAEQATANTEIDVLDAVEYGNSDTPWDGSMDTVVAALTVNALSADVAGYPSHGAVR